MYYSDEPYQNAASAVFSNESGFLSVSRAIDIINGSFRNHVGQLSVKGEVAKVSFNVRGHVYFDLRDCDPGKGSLLSCAVWSSGRRKMRLAPENFKDGNVVIADGRLEVYAATGRMTFIVDSLRHQDDKAGALLQAREELRRKLSAEGLFSDTHKRSLPQFARTVGIATSPTGQAIQDIRRTFAERAPHIKLVLSPCSCQGEGADLDIIRAMKLLEKRADIDCVIVGRGGGSQADLQCYDSERLVRFAAKYSKIVISAVGHEGDTPLLDLAADVRASTPTRAAELTSTPSRSDRLQDLAEYERRLRSSAEGKTGYTETMLDTAEDKIRTLMQARLNACKINLENMEERLRRHTPENVLTARKEQLRDIESRLHTSLSHQIETKYLELGGIAEKLRALSPERTLERGYAAASFADGRVITDASQANPGDQITVRLARGSIKASVTGIELELLYD